jgi:hypothetical protein
MNLNIEGFLEANQRREWDELKSPAQIQSWLDMIPYSTAAFNRSPLQVLCELQANCFDGALVAAARLRRLGYRPLIIDLLPEPGTDDEHILALFRLGSGWGAVAKSNFSGLRFREGIYHGLRELVMSYFEDFYNPSGKKTLRCYTRPMNLAQFDRINWETENQAIEVIEKGLDRLRPVRLLAPDAPAELTVVDARSYQAGLVGSNPAGLFGAHVKSEPADTKE